jgi:hypothetical protein
VNWLADNALWIWVGGAVAFTMATVVYSQTRSVMSLAAGAAVLVLTATLLVVEYVIETPREAVERTLYELAAAVEANDVDATLSYLAVSAAPEVRKEIREQMPLVKIERARVLSTPKIELASGPEPATATVQCRGLIVAVIKQTGMKGGAEDEVTLTFVKNGDRWQLENYTSKRNWNRALSR